MRVLFTDKQQLDLVEAQALADSGENTCYELVKALLFTSDYRVSGGTVNAQTAPDGTVAVDPGVFLKAGGFFYRMTETATMNVLSGSENTPANIWGTGEAADPSLPRKDIICVTYQKIANTPLVKSFINDSVAPPTKYTQTVNTRNESLPMFAVVHGTPSSTPAEPAVPSGFLKIATVLIPAGATTISTGDITNNLNINIKTLEQVQFSTQTQSAFSDLLHGAGVYRNVNGELQTTETAPQSMGVSVANGVALQEGITASFPSETTVPINAASFEHISVEIVDFTSSDTQTLQTNGVPPHKIRAGSVVVSGFTEGVDFSVDYSAGTMTRLGGGSIPPAGSVSAQYDYYLPRIDIIQVTFGSAAISAVDGIPGQTPVAPSPSANSIVIAEVRVEEGATIIENSNITDKRVYLASVQEIIDAHTSPESGANATLVGRLNAHENRDSSINTVHGIRQGSGNGFDADTVDGVHASSSPQPDSLLTLDSSSRYRPADGSQITNLTVLEASKLRVTPTNTPGDTVNVAPGTFLVASGARAVSYLGGTSTSFPVVTVIGQGRIDLLCIDDALALSRVAGVQANSPVAPEYPVNKLVLAEITVTNTTAVIIGTAQIRDVRNYLQSGVPAIGSSSIIAADGTTGQDITIGTGIKTLHVQNGAISLVKLSSDVLAAISASGVPPGMIMAYASGGTPPAGWVSCDGTSYGRAQSGMVNLFNAIGTEWGAIDGTHYNAPDLRGVVLRGWNGTASDGYADPDKLTRVARLGGGAVGNLVGSFQLDDIKSHLHTFIRLARNFGVGGGGSGNPGSEFTDNTGSTGNSETRMKNANIQWCIKL